MRNKRIVAPILIGVMALGLATASSVEAAPLVKMVTGTWRMVTSIPAGALGNDEESFYPLLGTFTADGRAILLNSIPGLPLPAGNDTVVTVGSPHLAAWEKMGGRLVGTAWRFLSDPATGQVMGFQKVTTRLWPIAPDLIVGEYSMEVLDAGGNPVLLGGQPMAFRGDVVGTRISPEALPVQ